MGGSSSGQVTGYKYLTNFLLFIGNPIERLLNINFDKRGWIANERISYGSNGEMIYIENINLYGENEGGVAGTMRVKHGTNNQTASTQYKKYMASLGLPASAYPYQSYIMFGGGGFPQGSWDLTEEELETIGDELEENDKYYNRGAFYVGNSGYMKEMLLWPMRIHVRNDGRTQWYDLKSEILEKGCFKSSTNNTWVKVDETRDVPAGVEVNISTTVIGGNYGVFDNIKETSFTPDSTGLIVPQSELDRFSVSNVFNEGDLRYVNFGQDTRATADLDHADFLDPNWEAHSVNPIPTNVSIESVGFDSMYFIDIKSRIELNDFSIKFSSRFSYIFTYRAVEYSGSVGLGYTEGILLAIVLAAGDSAEVSYTTRNKFYPDYTNGVVRSEVTVFATNIKLGRISKTVIGTDINPIHKIREILTDDTAMNKPESSINKSNFIKAADKIYDEGLGISWSITEKSCIDAINELCYHVEAGIRVNRQTGLYEMVLFRDNWFEENEIHTISESKIKSMQYEITNADEVINQVNVNYYDRANIKNSSFSISENGLIQTLGRVNAETVDFPYFMNMRNAEIVANWKLKLLSTGVYKGTFTTGWREARKWNRYDLIRLPWSKRWTGTILVRIMSINLGGPTNNEVSIDFVEVVPSTVMMNTTIVADDVIDKPLPPQSCQYEPFELPYYLAVMALGQRQVDDELTYENNFGLVGVVAEKPQSNSLYAVMMTNNGDGWIRAGSIQYSQTADLDQIISKTSSSFTVKNWRKITNVAAGTLIKCGRDWLGTPGEWMVFQGVDPYTGIVSVKRGALDTPPQEWGFGTKMYFCGNDISYDQTEYISSEDVLVSALTTTPSGVLEQGGSIPVEMKARAIRPYPPANVKINGEYWPEEIETDLILTWVDRNRVQQTGGEIIGWYEGGVTIETGVTYVLILVERDVDDVELRTQNLGLGALNTYTFATSAMDLNTQTIEITLKSLRDGYECSQPFEYTVELSEFFSAPYDLTVEFKND